MVHEFDLILQQQVGKGTVASVSYLGALGKELTNFVNTNLAPSTSNATITISDPNNAGPLPNGAVYVVPQYTGYVNKSFTNITEVIGNVNSNYNAVAFEVQNRSLKSVQFDVNYVWSHALDYNQNATTTDASNGQYDPDGNQTKDYGNSNYNVPDRVTDMCCTTPEHAARRLDEIPGERLGDRLGVPGAEWAALLGYAERLSFLQCAAQQLNGAGGSRGFRRLGAIPTSTTRHRAGRAVAEADLVHRPVQGRGEAGSVQHIQPPERDRSAEHGVCVYYREGHTECGDCDLPERDRGDCELRADYQLELERVPVHTAPSCDFVQVPLLTCSEVQGGGFGCRPISF